MASTTRTKKAKEIGEGVFETDTTIDTKAARVTNHTLLAEGAEAHQLETRSTVPLVDAGSGTKKILRRFQFKLPPGLDHVPSVQELFTTHSRQMRDFMWKDGVVPIEAFAPRILMDKDKQGFSVFVLCEPRFNTAVIETPQKLQDIFKPATK